MRFRNLLRISTKLPGDELDEDLILRRISTQKVPTARETIRLQH